MSRAPSDFDAVPVNRHFGFELVSRAEGEAVVTMPVRAEYLQEAGIVHGGVISSLADTAAVYCVYPEASEGRSITSIEFKMNFLRPALATAGDLKAHGMLVRKGRRVTLCLVQVLQADKLVALGVFTYLVYASDGEEGRG